MPERPAPRISSLAALKAATHKSPTQREIAACHHWLEDEIALVPTACKCW